MKYELLVATMNQTDGSLIRMMNINSSAIIINQCKNYQFDCFKNKDHTIKMYSFNEKGVGLSRNSALMRSYADIIEFADDDMIFVDDYEQKVVNEFKNHPEADAIIFSIDSMNPNRPFHRINSFSKVNKIEARKYGCARIAVRREKLIHHNVTFSLLFGGGSIYGAGEDTLFIKSMFDAGMKIYKSPVKVADVKQEKSSWFEGFNEKYYFDKGALMAAMYPTMCYLSACLMAMIHSKFKICKFYFYLKNYIRGIKAFKRCI